MAEPQMTTEKELGKAMGKAAESETGILAGTLLSSLSAC
jgi:hypothetical protein